MRPDRFAHREFPQGGAMNSSSSVRLTIVILATIILLVVIPGLQSTRAAGPWYVAPGGDDSNSCTSPGAPCVTINGAIGKAAGGDTIFVAAGIYSSASLVFQVVLLDKSVILSGGWGDNFSIQDGMSTVEGQGFPRGINVNSGVTVTIDYFVVQSGPGSVYGGIYNAGTLILSNSTVKNNVNIGSGGGIVNNGVLTLTNTVVISNSATGSGGGIYNTGILSVIRSTISGNSATATGGGIYNCGACISIINTSSVDHNITTVSGVYSFGGAGIYNGGGDLTLNNSTVSNNASAMYGGGIFQAGSLILNSSTVNRNTASQGGDGIYKEIGAITLQNTILYGNGTSDCWGGISSAGYNLVGNCSFTPMAGDLVNVNPMLFSLIGSPGYHPLLRGSPAINSGNPSGCADNTGNLLGADQRGIARVGRCDIGAYEYDPSHDPLSYVFLPTILRR